MDYLTLSTCGSVTTGRMNMVEVGSKWRHIARGTIYQVLHLAVLQTAESRELDGAKAVVYQAGLDNLIWVRPLSEFTDGRFEAVT